MGTTSPRVRTARRLAAASLAAASLAALAACGDSTTGDASGSDDAGSEVRIGYFPNITHATALIGDKQGYFSDELEAVDAAPTYSTFNSGTDAFQAVQDGTSLDMTFIGPGPSLSAFVLAPDSVRVISGAASGGASLVVADDVDDLSDLEGQKVATPSLGNTQDVAARAYFKEQGYSTDVEGGGDISIVPQDNPVTVQSFEQGDIAGAWLPEPWASILVSEGGKVLVDEADLWPQGEFVTTQLLVNKTFLDENPEEVEAVLKGVVESNAFINENSDEARDIAGQAVTELTDAPLPADVLADAWDNLTFTDDPIASSLEKDATDASGVELLDGLEDAPPVTDIYDLDPLNKILAAEGEKEIPAP